MGNSYFLTNLMEFWSPLYPLVATLHSIDKGFPCFSAWLPLRVTPTTPGVHLSPMSVFLKIDVPAFPQRPQGRQLHSSLTRLPIGSLPLQPASFLSFAWQNLCQETLCFGLPLTPPSSYVGELPNSYNRTLTDKSCGIQVIRTLVQNVHNFLTQFSCCHQGFLPFCVNNVFHSVEMCYQKNF